jgi:hypothetical protein
VDYEISPEPSAAERAAILEALSAEEREPPRGLSPWANSGLPDRETPADPEP